MFSLRPKNYFLFPPHMVKALERRVVTKCLRRSEPKPVRTINAPTIASRDLCVPWSNLYYYDFIKVLKSGSNLSINKIKM